MTGPPGDRDGAGQPRAGSQVSAEVAETVRDVAAQAWARVLQRDPFAVIRRGGRVLALPRGGATALAGDVDWATSARERLARVDLDTLTTEDRLTAEFVLEHLTHEIAEADRFWYRFPVTSYHASVLSMYRDQVFGTAELAAADDADRYLGLLDDYVAIVERMRATLVEQRRRGIRLSGWAAAAALETVRGHASAASELVPAPDRLSSLPATLAGRFTDRVGNIVGDRLATAFARLSADVTDDMNAAGTGVGIGQYPGGAACYAGLIRLHTGLDFTPERVHAIGVSEVERLTDQIRSLLGSTDEAAYRRELAAGDRLYATEPAEVERVFTGHQDRLRPHLSRYFATLPAAPFRLRRLDPSLEGDLTYGFYDPPGADGCGYYHYNGSDLPNRPLLHAASIIFHEGLPGHHLQLSRQAENTALPPIRREVSELVRTFALNGYFEGWAEYAAGLCAEIGLYDDPFDRYGRLSSARFHAARLVVDTGLNARGWTRARAADYLRANAFLSAGEVRTELLRYAVDDPGQALAYHLGHWFLRRLRGKREPREFHEAVLSSGPLPLPLLARHLERTATPGRAP